MNDAQAVTARLTRVDPPHGSLGAADANVRGLSQAPVSCEFPEQNFSDFNDDEQRQVQAGQLAALLRQKRQELDRRESQLNARQAQLENEARSSRLWLSERQQELQQQELTLRRREDQLEAEASRLAVAREASEREAAEFDEQLVERERQIAQARSEIRRAEDRLSLRESAAAAAEERIHRSREAHERQALVERQQWELEREAQAEMLRQASRQLDRRASELERREESLVRREVRQDAGEGAEALSSEMVRRLAEADSLLQRQLAEAAHEKGKLEAQRRRHTERSEQRTRELSWRAERIAESLRRERAKLHEQRRALRDRERAVEAMHEEGICQRRQALELRLAAEQLWVKVQGQAPPAELTRRLAKLRSELAQQERLSAAVSGEQRGEMQALAERLEARKQDLIQRQRELQEWAILRHREIEEQAARLVAREQELDEQERRYADCQRDWDEERRKFQRQIRELLTNGLLEKAGSGGI